MSALWCVAFLPSHASAGTQIGTGLSFLPSPHRAFPKPQSTAKGSSHSRSLCFSLSSPPAGFSVGSTVQSHTKGIWMWCVPHPRNPDHTLVLLDTEGLGDVEKVKIRLLNPTYIRAGAFLARSLLPKIWRMLQMYPTNVLFFSFILRTWWWSSLTLDPM